MLMTSAYMPEQCRNRAELEYVSRVAADRKGAEFTCNKLTDTQLYISVCITLYFSILLFAAIWRIK